VSSVRFMANKPSAVELWPFVEGSPLSLPRFLPRGSCGYVFFRNFVMQKLLLYLYIAYYVITVYAYTTTMRDTVQVLQ